MSEDETERRIELEGAGITLSGTFSNWSQWSLTDALEKRGARVYKKRLSPKTTIVIAGERPGDVVDKARMIGLPVVTEEGLKALFREGALVLVDAPEPEQPMDAVLGELRSILHGEEGHEVWPELVAYLDQSDVNASPVVIDYVQSHLARWEAEQTPERLAASYWRGDAQWLSPLHQPRCGHWRVAPLSWLMAMSRGEDSLKYRLVGGLSLGGTQLSTRHNRAVVERPDLVNVQGIYMGGGCKYTVSLMKHVADSGQYASARTLWFNSSGPKGNHLRALRDASGLPNLEHLAFCWDRLDRAFPAERLDALVEADALQGVTTLETAGFSDRLLLRLMGGGRFPAVERVVIGDRLHRVGDTIQDMSPIFARDAVRVLGFAHLDVLRRYSEAMRAAHALPELECIDLSPVMEGASRFVGREPDEVTLALTEPDPLLAHVGAVRLGQLAADPRWVELMDAWGVRVVG